MVQPWPTLFAKHTSKTDGNVLGLERFNKNMIREFLIFFIVPAIFFFLTRGLAEFLFDYCWDDEADDALFQRLARSAVRQLDGYAQMVNAENGFIYLNYADKTQNPLKSYGEENVKYIRRVANTYDPYGVFQHQVPGGFKISNVN